MGNCIRKGSYDEWGGDDWGSFGAGHEKTRKDDDGALPDLSSSSLAAAGKEVKITISKKELERLLKEVDVEGLPVQQVLAQLLNAHQQPRTPALQSIPE